MEDLQNLRTTILKDVDPLGTKQRFALFSQPITLAIGDDGQYKKKIHPRNPEGKPVTQPRNFQVSPNKNGQVNSSFFQPLASLAASKVADPYIDPARKVLLSARQTYLKGKNHEVNFFPASGRKTLASSSYIYVQQKETRKDPKSHRNSEGRVIVQPRNVVTNPMQKVDRTYFKFPNHMQQPYQRHIELERKQRKIAKSKEHENVFKSMVYSPRDFNKSSQVFGEDVKLQKKQQKQTKFNIYKHQTVFRPSNPNKQGLYGYFTPFPAHKPDPPKQKIRDRSHEGKQKKEVFKKMVASLTRPTPSIASNPINMRKYINHSFSHRF